MPLSDVKKYLQKKQLISGDLTEIIPLSGGVSSEIYLVREKGKSFVVKKALPKLKVAADWYADIARNETEQAYINYVQQWLPKALPEVLFSDPDEGLFIMEYLGEGFVNWKQKLLKQQVEAEDTRDAARILATIHRQSWSDPIALSGFDTTQNFFELRLEPYLLATAEKHPELKTPLNAASELLAQTRQCLVHGDFSPKNILIGVERMVILDCEVAWYGDPAFDVAFCLNHFLLKSLHFVPDYAPFIRQVSIFRDQYRQTIGHLYVQYQLEERLSHLLPMLLLARVDGKSPVEYIKSASKKMLIRDFVKASLLKHNHQNLDELLATWKKTLEAV